MSLVYADSTATGANDGTSWTDAYTNLATALAALSAGDTLYSNAPEATPFQGGDFILSANRTWIGNEGPDGETWVTDTYTSSAWSESSGVWSISLAFEPQYVVYDFKRDDLAGTVTGFDVGTNEAGHYLSAFGWDLARCVAWYGFLENAGATTTPADGQYGYTGGTLYINPPGTPAEADVDALTRYGHSVARQGVQCYDNTTVRGVTFWLYPSSNYGGASNAGYAVQARGSTIRIEDCTGIACGWHSFGAATNDAEDRVTISRCLALGSETESPYVFYTEGSFPNSGHKLLDSVAIQYQHLNTDGALLGGGNWEISGPFLSHTGGAGSPSLGGMQMRRCVFVNASSYIDEASILLDNPSPTTGSSAGYPAFTEGVWGSYPLLVYDCAWVGNYNIPFASAWDRCVLDRSMLGVATEGQRGNTHPRCYIKNSFIDHGRTDVTFHICDVGSGGQVRFEDCYIRVEGNSLTDSCFFNVSTTDTDRLILSDNQFDTGGTIQSFARADEIGTSTVYDSNAAAITAANNVFNADIVRTWVFRNEDAANRNMAWWQSNVSATDGNGPISVADKFAVPNLATVDGEVPSIINTLLRAKHTTTEGTTDERVKNLRRAIQSGAN